MDKVTIHISANEQLLTSAECPLKVASNTVSYIEAVFELGENWTGYDSVRAVWSTYMDTIATVLDSEGKCVVPHEVMTRTQKVFVNLVGSVVEDDELTDRLTTYPILAVVVNADALVEGTETAPITPSQFEQFVAEVSEEVSKIKDIVSTTLNDDYTLTFVFSDGTETTVGPIRGEQGPQGETGPQGPEGPPGEVTLATLESLMPTDTANGSIASFPDGQSVFPLKSLVADINPIQDLHGYDSPWVGGAGANKYDKSIAVDDSRFTTSGTGTVAGLSRSDYIEILPNTAYYFMGVTPNNSGYSGIFWYDENKSFVRADGTNGATSTTPVNLSVTSPSTAKYVGINMFTTNKDNGAVNYPSTVTTLTPYSNICPISGWNSVGVVVDGKNLFSGLVNGYYNSSTGAFVANNSYSVSAKIQCTSSKQYVFSLNGSAHSIYVYEWDRFGNYIGRKTVSSGSMPFTPSANAYELAIASQTINKIAETDKPQLEIGNSATSYEAYNGTTHTTTLPSTVYGGSDDIVSGVGSDEWALYTFDGSADESWNINAGQTYLFIGGLANSADNNDTTQIANWLVGGGNSYNQYGKFRVQINGILCVGLVGNDGTNWSDVATFKTWLSNHNLQICYKKATADSFTTTPTTINTLKGTNNIFADSGDVSVEYVADIQGYIDKQ